MRDLVRCVLVGETAAPTDVPFDRAVFEATAAAGLGGAFLAGYRGALRALVPDLPAGRNVCLCATEQGGAHPRAIATRLEQGRVTGRKKWVTGGTLADLLLVIASVGADDAGRNALRAVLVAARGPGVTLHPAAPTPFVPEIPHAEVELAGAPVLTELPGDGYLRYLKPFRTVEDVYVYGAVLAWVLGVARRYGWPRALRQRGVAVLLAARAVALEDPSARETHAALGGVLDLGRRLFDDAEEQWASVDPPLRDAWQRDRVLLDVAARARAARDEAAWNALTGA